VLDKIVPPETPPSTLKSCSIFAHLSFGWRNSPTLRIAPAPEASTSHETGTWHMKRKEKKRKERKGKEKKRKEKKRKEKKRKEKKRKGKKRLHLLTSM